MVRLYDKAIEYADLKGGETVLDLYCGVGTIGLFCAREMNEKNPDNPGQVIGIESVKGAILDANRNATINGIVNARYVCGKAEEELPKMMGLVQPEDGKEPKIRVSQADVAILDPPRAGCDVRLLEAVVKAEPSRIVYVSCDPATLARDIKWLGENGYEFVEATPCDMFPHTAHCEVVTKLVRK
ncbi:MAG: class I SAM-dependent RNA methyltransferase, partial [Firmicutes bacterium]|nr:class I SAM-dependent RNA methyltransferase [Bacillota bacterium]